MRAAEWRARRCVYAFCDSVSFMVLKQEHEVSTFLSKVNCKYNVVCK